MTHLPAHFQGTVFRALRSGAWRNTQSGEIKPDAFFRREATEAKPETEVGISVMLGVIQDCDAAKARARAQPLDIKGCAYLQSLEIVSAFGLEVIQDRTDHGNIMGTPLRSENKQLAEDIAKFLSRIASNCDQLLVPRPAPPLTE